MIRHRIQIRGIVQGVGFRPFVWQLANHLKLAGWVLNDTAGVTIEIQGDITKLEEFGRLLRSQSPPLVKIESVTTEEILAQEQSDFQIRESVGIGQQITSISPDISICDECISEFFDQTDRRYQYPFINCTNCGPRFTIIESVPYDRSATAMKAFPMCDRCQAEYDDPSNRRFHAQPNACPTCGPVIWMADTSASFEQFNFPPHNPTIAEVQLAFDTAIKQGKIVAIKGIGGFHLACDATNESAVACLRERKGRVDKPFAVMVRDSDQASLFAAVSLRERQLLESRERPIVLLNKVREANDLANNVSPQNNFIGVMLPYSPLHYLLMNVFPLLMTSGNLSDEPIVRANDEALQRLGNLADAFLLHDRQIHTVCDDSVVRNVDDELLPIRRSRGYAPMPIRLTNPGETILAVGGEIKSTFCLAKGDHALMSQHIGDMDNAETLSSMQQNVKHFTELFQAIPKAIAADLHPGYLSGQWAGSFARQLGIPIFRIQHHFAHVVSLMAEKDLPPKQKIIGCCFDGTGYGTDGAIWGGEFLIADTVSFVRFASLANFPLPGGDASIKRPGRVALTLLWSHQMDWSDQLAPVRSFQAHERKILRQQLERDLNCVPTSSMGRLFDSIAALIGLRQEINYEAQAALQLEAIASKAIDSVVNDYAFEVIESSPMRLGTRKLLQSLCNDLNRGTAAEEMGAKFHHAVADAIVTVCRLARDDSGIETVGLTGGVFQNVLLLRLAIQKLQQQGFQVLAHSIVPPNDAGLALGQVVVARNWLAGDREN